MTQKEMVLKYLKEYGSITTLEAATRLYIMDLQGVIRHLKEEYNISDEWVNKTNMYGKKVEFKRYSLKED